MAITDNNLKILPHACGTAVFRLVLATIFLFGFSEIAIGQSTLTFNDLSPVLETGSPLSQGARYRFSNVAPGTDALVTIVTISNATLVTLDNNTIFVDRFQPTIRTLGTNTEGHIRFDFTIVEAGTSIQKIVPAVFISTQDIDGNGVANEIREWVEFFDTGPVSTGTPTTLTTGTPVAGGIRYNQSDSLNGQAGIGTDDQYELYTTILGSTATFTIIGGNMIGSAGCSGSICDRLNSYAFDPSSSNQPPPNADVSITKTGPASVNVNDNVTYTIVGSNAGPTTAHGAIVNDAVPAGLTGVTITCAAAGAAVCPVTTGLTTISNLYIPTFPVGGSVTFTVSGTASSAGTLNNVATIDPPPGGTDPNLSNNTSATIVTTVIDPPSIGLVKACTVPADCVTAPQLPDTQLTYQIDFTNTGGSSAANLAMVDAIPNDTDFQVGSATVNVGTTGLTFVLEYSDDYDSGNPSAATWTYTPVSGGGGADAGFDRNVLAIRWRVTSGSLSQTAPNNAGSVSIIAKIR